MDNNSNFNIFAKLVAISIVGGVAKSLFGQPVLRPATINQYVEGAKDVVDTVKGGE